MKQIIYPLNLYTNPKTWINYSTYIRECADKISSLQNYLNYFQPTFIILNQSTDYTDVITGKGKTKEGSVDISEWTYNVYLWSYPQLTLEKTRLTYITTDGSEANPDEESLTVKYYWVKGEKKIGLKTCTKIYDDIARYFFLDDEDNIIDYDTKTGKEIAEETINIPANAIYLVLQDISFEDEFVEFQEYTDSEKLERGTPVSIYSLNSLKWKEGVYCASDNTYFCVSMPELFSKLTNEKFLYKEDLNSLLKNNILKAFPMSFVLFAKKWVHSGEHTSSTEHEKLDHYFLMAQSYTPLYYISTYKNTITASSLKDGPATLGSKFLITFEKTPSRYFLTKDRYYKWDRGAILWQLLNMDWLNDAAIISSSKEMPWVGTYPLMTQPILEDTQNVWEDFIFDGTITTDFTRVENHAVSTYNISINEDGDNLIDWSDFVFINLC